MVRFNRVTVIQGGTSSEREVSLRSGAAMAKAFGELSHEVAVFDPKTDDYEQLIMSQPDAAVIALHGNLGEDGCIQGLLECHKIPYTGSGLCASALCYDKIRSKIFLKHYRVATPDFWIYNGAEDLTAFLQHSRIPTPVIVKPSREGSTVGIVIVHRKTELEGAILQAQKFCREVLIERFITGREVTAGVIDGEPLPLIEVAPKSGFYDYEAKYTPGKTDYILPARVSKKIEKKTRELSAAIYSWLGCRGAARVDYIVDKKHVPQFLEINTIPGMTETSLLPKAAAAAGIDFNGLCEKILQGATLDGGT